MSTADEMLNNVLADLKATCTGPVTRADAIAAIEREERREAIEREECREGRRQVSARRERFLRFVSDHERPGVTDDELAVLMDEWCESEVHLALQPSAPSPELAEIVAMLSASELDQRMRTLTSVECSRILAELDRLRARVAGLEAQAVSLQKSADGWREKYATYCHEYHKAARECRAAQAENAAPKAQIAKYQAGGLLMPEEDAAKMEEG